jgi:hypothetical protein
MKCNPTFEYYVNTTYIGTGSIVRLLLVFQNLEVNKKLLLHTYPRTAKFELELVVAVHSFNGIEIFADGRTFFQLVVYPI